MHSKYRYPAAMLLTAVMAAGCTTMGVGTGETSAGGAVNFEWSSDNATSGTMSATVMDQTYSGRFFQITTETRVDDLQPLWIGWRSRFRDWPYWGDDFGPSFITHYSGRVLANLKSPSGEHLRCNFRLVRPASGMKGGGEGRCQQADGNHIDATFPAA